jgi:putative nucleotidyltransferase with HDIG domain
MEITKDQINKIEQYVSSRQDSLNWYHTQGVRQIARKLAGLEKADKGIVDVATLFHDLGKIKIPAEGHSQKSAELTRNYLEKERFEQRFVEEAVYCIIAHELPWQNQSNLVNTPEAKVVFDANIIQQLSEFGVIKQALIHRDIFDKDFKQGLIVSRDNLFRAYNLIFTKNGRKMAEKGYKLVKEFYNNLL